MSTLSRLLIFILLSSCVNQSSKSFDDVVTIDDLNSDNRVNISEENVQTYGPQESESFKYDDEKVEAKELFAIDFYPALYKSFGYISIVKQLNKEALKPVIISSSGFASIIAVCMESMKKQTLLSSKPISFIKV